LFAPFVLQSTILDMRSFVLGLLALTLPLVGSAQPYEPVNENATPEARQLLQYLYEIQGEHILSGQHDYNNSLTKYTERVHEMTGKRPAVWGSDFINHESRDRGEAIVQEAIRKHENGAIITLMWHAGRPTDEPPYPWTESIQGEVTVEEWDSLTTPGTAIHERWKEQVDGVAEHLQTLQEADVPVLWRPYHEMNGGWFWWGHKMGDDGFVQLWRMLYDRLVNHHELNNLLWVWNANAPRDIPNDRAHPYEYYYPGHQTVDILAADVYHFDYEQNEYHSLLTLADGRPIALGEVGQLPKPEILEAQPQWTWFMVWSQWLETHNPDGRVEAVYEYAPTLSLDDVTLQ
jgi:mannan endo-1,4-beta-mannosidase